MATHLAGGGADVANLSELFRRPAQTTNIGIAKKWYQKSADLRFAPAMDNLGQIYLHGTGGLQDHGRAFDLHMPAARAGNPVARWNVAIAYRDGHGVDPDPAEAAKWEVWTPPPGIMPDLVEPTLARTVLFGSTLLDPHRANMRGGGCKTRRSGGHAAEADESRSIAAHLSRRRQQAAEPERLVEQAADEGRSPSARLALIHRRHAAGGFQEVAEIAVPVGHVAGQSIFEITGDGRAVLEPKGFAEALDKIPGILKQPQVIGLVIHVSGVTQPAHDRFLFAEMPAGVGQERSNPFANGLDSAIVLARPHDPVVEIQEFAMRVVKVGHTDRQIHGPFKMTSAHIVSPTTSLTFYHFRSCDGGLIRGDLPPPKQANQG